MSQHTTRREFVKSAAATGVGLSVAPGLARAMGAERSPSDRIVVAVMGTNSRGAVLARVFARQPGAEVAFICDPEEGALAKGIRATLDAREKTPEGRKDFREILDAFHVANFLESIRSGKTPTADPATHHPSTLMPLLGNIAYRLQRDLRCDPKTGRVLDDPEAQAMWTREYEPGWEPRV